MRLVLVWGGALACATPPGPPPPVAPDPPTIAALEVGCDVEAATWSIVLETTGWVGAAITDWTVDGLYLERHRLDSVAYERDGSAESLELELAVASDWRKVGRNRTGFACSDPVDILLTVSDLDEAPADCRAIGPNPSRWAEIEGTASCDTSWPE